jgi:hypothetical protein
MYFTTHSSFQIHHIMLTAAKVEADSSLVCLRFTSWEFMKGRSKEGRRTG